MALATTTAISAIGIATGLIGTGVSYIGAKGQTRALKQAEKAREKQMNLDANRRRREIVRNMISARAQATFNAYSQGGGEGSGLQGGLGQVTGDAAQQTLATNQNQQIGQDIFSANAAYYNASTFTNAGGAMQSLGGAIVQNAGTIGRVANYAMNRREYQ